MKILNKLIESVNNSVIVYHGSNTLFNEFKNPSTAQNHYDSNLYFTDNIKLAKIYGNNIIKLEIDVTDFDGEIDANGKTFNELMDEEDLDYKLRHITDGFIIRNVYDHPNGDKKNKSTFGNEYVIPFDELKDKIISIKQL